MSFFKKQTLAEEMPTAADKGVLQSDRRSKRAENAFARVFDGLLDTLQREIDAVQELQDRLGRQREAMGEGVVDAIDETSVRVDEATRRVGKIRQQRPQQMHLLARLLDLTATGDEPSLEELAEALAGRDTEARRALLEARQTLRTEAGRARQQCEELTFSLQYMSDLHHDMLATMRGLAAPAEEVYTKDGYSAASNDSPTLINRTG